jgi:hypothetical protein
MDGKTLALIEMLAFTGIALAIGLQQLWSINRTLKKTEAEEAERLAQEGQAGDRSES